MNKLYIILTLAGLLPLKATAQPGSPPALSGTVSTLAGTAGRKGSADGTGAAARFDFPHGVAVDASGTVYVADTNSHTVRKITPAGVVTTLAGQPGHKGSLDGLAGAAQFNSPAGIALAADGTLYVADAGAHTIRKISTAGLVTTLAGAPGQRGTADGAGAAARFNTPHAVAIAADGTVYVADTYNHTIRTITPAGVVATLAGRAGHRGTADGAGVVASFRHPAGLAVDAQHTLCVADNGSHTIRRVSAAGEVRTLAGLAGHKGSADGPGPAARFDVPAGLALDAEGTLYVVDYFNSCIRQVAPQGQVRTLAGVPRGWRSLDGPRAEARFEFPFGIAVGTNGWVYVAESGANTIRIIK